MDDIEAGGFLDSLALGGVLDDLGLDGAEGLDRFGFKGSSRADRDALEGSKTLNDSDDDSLEADIDRELEEEDRLEALKAAQGPAQFAQVHRFRGEEDNYDDIDIDDEIVSNPDFTQRNDAQFDFGGQDAFGDWQGSEDERLDEFLGIPSIPNFSGPNQQMRALDVNALFPNYKQSAILDFTDYTASRPRKRQKLSRGTIQLALPPAGELEDARTTKDSLNAAGGLARYQTQTHMQANKLAVGPLAGDVAARPSDRASSPEGAHIDDAYAALQQTTTGWILPEAETLSSEKGAIFLDNWEDRIVWSSKAKTKTNETQLDMLRVRKSGQSLPFRNRYLDDGEWSKSIIWDRKTPYTDFTRLQINVDDPDLAIQAADQTAGDGKMAALAARKRQLAQNHLYAANPATDIYNLSNDRIYESLRQADKRKAVRQTFGSLEVQHSYPALKLQLPLYRTTITKAEARAWHRPPLLFPNHTTITFERVRSAKKTKKQEKAVLGKSSKADNPIKSTGDLSLRDSAPFVLTEYSEEYPPLLSNIGMGSIIVNYYRKKNAKDEQVPKVDLGDRIVLDEKDDSPFLKLGNVDPEQIVPALYNNLTRAPLFKHEANKRDFLVVKTTVDGQTSYFLRDIKNLYTVGQTYYVTEVPGPHSRKVTAMNKQRLQAIAARLCEHNENKRIPLRKLLRYFPDQTELQMRQKLKEFMEYVRKGSDQGFWMMKATAKSYEEALRDVRPEDIVLSESMQVGQRHLLDSGFGGEEDTEKDNMKEEDVMKLDIEQQLAPWVASKNFMATAAGKAMLKLHGEGDPTGRGEGFNFQRVSMKEIFLREGETMEGRQREIDARPKSSHKYNVAEQQEIYRQEVDRIWRAQLASLANPRPPHLTRAEEELYQKRQRMLANNTPGGTPAAMASPGQMPSYDEDGQIVPKILRIKRQDHTGAWTTEVVRDQNVIKAYVRSREASEADLLATADAESFVPGSDPVKNEKMMKALAEKLAKSKHNQDRRLQRKGTVLTEDPNIPESERSKLARPSKPETTRRCGNCGQVGHMKTNRKCPRWAEFNGPNAKPSPAVPGGPTPDATSPAGTPGVGPAPGLGSMAGLLNPFQ